MKYIVGNTKIKFDYCAEEVNIRYVFSIMRHMIIFAQREHNGHYLTLSESAVADVEAAVLGDDTVFNETTTVAEIPDWAISRLIDIQVVFERKMYSYQLSELEAEVDRQLSLPMTERKGFDSAETIGVISKIIQIGTPKAQIGNPYDLKVVIRSDSQAPTLVPLSVITDHAQADQELPEHDRQALCPFILKGLVELLKEIVLLPLDDRHVAI
ncbi:MAG: hypothetical protein RSG77_21835 [Hafnia sp.]